MERMVVSIQSLKVDIEEITRHIEWEGPLPKYTRVWLILKRVKEKLKT